jgi:rod shape determining protein RodA
MNRIWRQFGIASNWPITLAVLVLAIIGVVTIYFHAPDNPDDARKQAAFVVVGFGLLLAMQGASYVFLGRFAWPFYLLSLALLLYTVLPGVPRAGFLGVPEIRGQRNWINFGMLKLQPAELMKVAFCVVLARYLRFRSNYRTLAGLIPPFLLALVPLVVIMMQPDLGTAIVFIPALFAMLFMAGARLKHLLAIVGIGLALMPVAWYAGPKEKTGLKGEIPILKHLPALVKKYQRDRVYALFSRNDSMLRSTGFQQEQAVIALGSGGFSGKGAGVLPVGRAIPEAHNDMIFALIGEQFGFIGVAVTLAAYLVLFTTGVEIAAATREPFGRLVAVGTVALLAAQTFVNVTVALRLMPVTGITLPFVSYGGSSLLASFVAAGLLLNIGQNRPLVLAGDAFEFE